MLNLNRHNIKEIYIMTAIISILLLVVAVNIFGGNWFDGINRLIVYIGNLPVGFAVLVIIGIIAFCLFVKYLFKKLFK